MLLYYTGTIMDFRVNLVNQILLQRSIFRNQKDGLLCSYMNWWKKKITDCQVLFLEDFKWSNACVVFATQETRTQWMICETAQCEQWASTG